MKRLINDSILESTTQDVLQFFVRKHGDSIHPDLTKGLYFRFEFSDVILKYPFAYLSFSRDVKMNESSKLLNEQMFDHIRISDRKSLTHETPNTYMGTAIKANNCVASLCGFVHVDRNQQHTAWLCELFLCMLMHALGCMSHQEFEYVLLCSQNPYRL